MIFSKSYKSKKKAEKLYIRFSLIFTGAKTSEQCSQRAFRFNISHVQLTFDFLVALKIILDCIVS